MRRGSWLHLYDTSFVAQDRIAGSDRDAPERGDRLTVELFNAQQDVGFVHRLEVEVSADDTVGVDDRATHVGPDLWSVGGLEHGGGDRSGWQAVETSDQEVDEVGRADAGEGGYVDIRNTGDVSPVSEDQTNLPFEVISIGLVGVRGSVKDRPFTHISMLESGDLPFGES